MDSSSSGLGGSEPSRSVWRDKLTEGALLRVMSIESKASIEWNGVTTFVQFKQIGSKDYPFRYGNEFYLWCPSLG